MKSMLWLGEKVDMICVSVGQDRECCANCNYFHQHYVRNGPGNYSALSWGHCAATRVRNKNAIDYCPNFKKGGEGHV